jgi:hypothetical protein
MNQGRRILRLAEWWAGRGGWVGWGAHADSERGIVLRDKRGMEADSLSLLTPTKAGIRRCVLEEKPAHSRD